MKRIILFACMILAAAAVDAQVTNTTHPANSPYATIQAAIDDPITVAGDVITVAAGTYVEQVTINKDLTLIGASAATTIIKAPATIPAASNATSTIVDIDGAGVDVEISGFTVTGPGPSGCGSIGVGIFVRGGAHANIHDNKILDIRDNPISGCQNGIGIIVGRALFSTTGTATIKNNVISGYQKGGIVVSNTGSSATITGNTVTGAGAVNFIAQNGIQVSGGATGDIINNEVSGHSYTPFTFVSTGMLLFAADANTDDNTLSENQVGIYHIEGSGTHEKNDISASAAGTGSPGFWGIVADPGGKPRALPDPFEAASAASAALQRSNSVASIMAFTSLLDRNTLTGDGGAGGVGIEMDALGTETLNCTATANVVKNWEYGFYLYKDPGATLNANIIDCNQIFGNTAFGVFNSTGVSANAVGNWWGSSTGPSGEGPGAGDAVSADLLFNPWGLNPSCGGQGTHNVVFLAGEDVILDRHGASEGDIHANNDIVFKKGKPSTMTGDLTAVDDITIQTKNTIDGVATAGDDIDLEGTAVVTGGANPNTPVAAVALPSLSFSHGSSDVTVPKNGALTLAPGFYDDVKVEKNGTLNLSSGDYFLDELDLKESAKLIIDVEFGPVTINVVDKLSFGKKVVVSITPSGEAGSDQVTFTQLDDSRLTIGQQARVLGTIIAVEAEVRLSKNSRYKGSICAEEIVVDQGTVFLPHGSSTSLPIQNTPDFEDVDLEEEIASAVTDYELSANYPNPFNPSTTIKFALPEAAKVALKIYTIGGQLVTTLVDGEMSPGRHSLSWNGRNRDGAVVASGIYFYRLVAQKQNGEAAFTQTRRMTLVK